MIECFGKMTSEKDAGTCVGHSRHAGDVIIDLLLISAPRGEREDRCDVPYVENSSQKS